MSASSPSSGIRISRGIDYLGQLGARLRDLQGYATLAFELIQNADDVRSATRIRFDVREDALHVENDGVFSSCGDPLGPECLENTDPLRPRLCDFHRFRIVAAGNKRHEEGTAGAFGVGFTAVYQMTDRPELLSQGQHWILEEEKDEADRIFVCSGCAECEATDASGTRFRLPWAGDPNSALRARLGASAVGVDAPEHFISDLEGSLGTVLLFLRRLRTIELLRNGRPVRTIRREDSDGSVVLYDGEERTDWILIDGDFEAEASRVREDHPNKIETKRQHSVRLAVPLQEIGRGVFSAFLPTRHDLGLPLHLHADFFPSNDRKRIVFGSDYQAEWNEAAIRAAAKALAGGLPRLAEGLGHARLWKLISAVSTLHKEAIEGRCEEVLGAFWTEVERTISYQSIVYTQGGAWRQPIDEIYLVDSNEADIAWLESIGLECVHPDLRPHMNLLRQLRIRSLDIEAFARALERLGLDAPLEPADWPPAIQGGRGLATLWTEATRLLVRGRSAEDQAEARARLSSCSLALGRDGTLHPCAAIFRADPETCELFERIEPTLRFAIRIEEMGTAIEELIPEFMPKEAVAALGRAVEREGSLAAFEPAPMLEWLEARLPHFASDGPLCHRLKELPIFPSKSGLHRLENLVLPGGFDDPVGLASVLDASRAGRSSLLLKCLGARTLTLERYVVAMLPQALGSSEVPHSAKLRAVDLLADNLDTLCENESIPKRLADVPAIPCTDGVFRPAAHVYFDSAAVREVLADTVPYAKLSSEPARRRALFEWLGVYSHPRFEQCVRRIGSVVTIPPTPASLDVVAATFKYLGKQLKDRNDLPNALLPLRSLAWLPSERDPRRWFAPSEVHASFRRHLYASQVPFLALPLPLQSASAKLIELLGIQHSPTPELMVQHLLECAETGQPVSQEVYVQLGAVAEKPVVQRLRDRACILLPDNRYVRPADVFWGAHGFGSFRIRLSESLQRYAPLFSEIGVRQVPDVGDALRVLHEIGEAHRKGADDEVLEVARRCWQIINEAVTHGQLPTGIDVDQLADVACIPTENRRLLCPREVLFESRAGLAASFPDWVRLRTLARPAGVWKAMIKAGARNLTDEIQTLVLGVEDQQDQPKLNEHLQARGTLVARVLEATSGGVAASAVQEVFASLQFTSVRELIIQPILRIDGNMISGNVESVSAHYQRSNHTIYFVPVAGLPPWTLLARELALALRSDAEPGQIAPALKEILFAETFTSASVILDELGFPPLADEVSVKLPEGVVTHLGGESRNADARAGQSEVAETPPSIDCGEPIEARASDPSLRGADSVEGADQLGSALEISPPPASPLPSAALDKNEAVPSPAAPIGLEGRPPVPSRRATPTLSSSSEPESSPPGTPSGHGSPTGAKADPVWRGDFEPGEEEAVPGAVELIEFQADPSSADTTVLSYADSKRGLTAAGSSRRVRRQSRLLSYVVSEDDSAPTMERGEAPKREREQDEARQMVNRAGVELVMSYEARHQRSATEMSHTNPGYDVLSRSQDGATRYIEVKSISGQWRETGVAVSRVQFEFGKKEGDAFWLYVVENALDPDRARVYPIQNAARRVGEFVYDHGWKNVAQLEAGR